MSFEAVQSAKRRNENKESEPQAKRQKTHTGKFDTMTWDKEALKAEAESYINDDKEINWSELARKHHVTTKNGEVAKNGGQIIKEYLKSEGVDVNRFKRKSSDGSRTAPRVRRKKRKTTGGEEPVPTEPTVDELKQMARDKIESGEITVGERIVPRKVCAL